MDQLKIIESDATFIAFFERLFLLIKLKMIIIYSLSELNASLAIQEFIFFDFYFVVEKFGQIMVFLMYCVSITEKKFMNILRN
jgi:uncharacterized membrane protein YiaA